MRTINVHQAKTQLSRILEEVAGGEEIILAKFGKPMALLTPYQRRTEKRQFFQLEGKITMAPDFQDTPNEFSQAFGDPKASSQSTKQ